MCDTIPENIQLSTLPSDVQSFILSNNSKIQKITKIQSLWAGYGSILKIKHEDNQSFIIKYVLPPDDPTETKKHREWKLKTYKVEEAFYKNYQNNSDVPGFENWRTAKFYGSESFDTETGFKMVFRLEDLDDSGYPGRFGNQSNLSVEQVKPVLAWLAGFHASFMDKIDENNENEHNTYPDLWEFGSYWNLKTRIDQWEKLPESELKRKSSKIDNIIKNSKFQTLLHGDAKTMNFCFHKTENEVSAVDFQYVGKGPGIRDVWYLFSSCLEDTGKIDLYKGKAGEAVLLEFYFSELKTRLNWSDSLFEKLEKEYRELYPVCIADFERFVRGAWPDHYKLTDYTKKVTEGVCAKL
jgi:hypothetical protein